MKTPEQLLSDVINTFPKAVPAKEYLIKECLDRGINTPLRIAHFFAQVAHESGNFQYSKELGGNSYFAKYDTGRVAKNLGNTPEADGDGALYKGRGFIQVTGRANVRAASKAKYGDGRLLLDPSWLETPEGASWSACWFWDSRNLNELADKDDVLGITKKVNGGTNGLDDRKAKLSKLKSTLGIK